MKDGRHIAFCDPEPSHSSYLLDTRHDPSPPYADPREHIRDILQYGPDLNVVAPENLRTAVGARLAEACRVYEIRPRGLTE